MPAENGASVLNFLLVENSGVPRGKETWLAGSPSDLESVKIIENQSNVGVSSHCCGI